MDNDPGVYLNINEQLTSSKETSYRNQPVFIKSQIPLTIISSPSESKTYVAISGINKQLRAIHETENMENLMMEQRNKLTESRSSNRQALSHNYDFEDHPKFHNEGINIRVVSGRKQQLQQII